jgi:hypothetical protein
MHRPVFVALATLISTFGCTIVSSEDEDSSTGGSGSDTGGNGGAADGSGGSAGDGASGNGGTNGTNPECASFARGTSTGDPHLITLDGLYYDFQASGEFVLAKDGAFEVQVRQQGTGQCASVAYNTALALRNTGTPIMVVASETELVKLGDGRIFPAGTLDVTVGDWHLTWVCDELHATYKTGDVVVVRPIGSSWLNVQVLPTSARAGKLSGLLGNADGDPENDLALADESTLGSSFTEDALYGGFARTWQITEDASAFIYATDEPHFMFAMQGAPGKFNVNDIAAEELAAATTACAEVKDDPRYEGCLVDVVCGGVDPSLAASWFLTTDAPEHVAEIVEPSVEDPCYVNGGTLIDRNELTFQCPANCSPGALWGTDVYTDDSSVCTAAVHAGIFAAATGGRVQVADAPGQDEYTGSERNGITSMSWGSWGRSFTVSAVTAR